MIGRAVQRAALAAWLATVLAVASSSPAAGRSIYGTGAQAAATPAGGWSRLPAAPTRPDSGLASVWTGREMLVFGRVTKRGQNGEVLRRTDVAAGYDPATRTWRRLPSPGPTSSFLDSSAVWTGKEMLVWGQGTREAYNPQTNRWRKLPGSPLLAIHDGFGLVVWTGREMIGWGGGCCGDAFSDGVAYSPATNTWRAVARSPLAGSQHPLGAWTGRELIVLVGRLDADGKPWPARLAQAAAYDPARERWRRITQLPAPREGANVVWDGREVLVVGGRGGAVKGSPPPLRKVGFAYDPARNRWRRLPAMESGRETAAAVWTGTQLLVVGGRAADAGPAVLARRGLAYDPQRNRWSPLPEAPLRRRIRPTAVWTGRALIAWGGTSADTKTLFFDGAAFTPRAS